MRRQSDIYRLNWRERLADEGSVVELVARHIPRQRMPRGHEFAQNLMAGQHIGTPIEEFDYQWVVLRDGERVGSLRENPNGSFSMGSVWSSGRQASLFEAAKSLARHQFGPPRPLAGSTPSFGR